MEPSGLDALRRDGAVCSLQHCLAAKGSPSIFRMQDHKIAQQEKQALLLWLMSQLCKQVSLKPPFIVLYLPYGL